MRRDPGLITPEDDERRALEHEAEALHTLQQDAGKTAGLAMEILAESLPGAAKQGLLTQRRLTNAVRPTCKAFKFLHSKHIADVDVKAANVAFTANYNEVKVLDFDAAMVFLGIGWCFLPVPPLISLVKRQILIHLISFNLTWQVTWTCYFC